MALRSFSSSSSSAAGLALACAAAAVTVGADTTLRVSADGRGGSYTSVQGALDSVAGQAGTESLGRLTILLTGAAGPLFGRAEVWPNFTGGVDLVGDPSLPAASNLVTYNVSGSSGPGTFGSWTVRAWGPDFRASNVAFANSADGYNASMAGQSVAVDLEGDRAGFWGCGFYGAQDTLYTGRGRSFFSGAFINGTCDAIFGSGASVFADSAIRMNYTVTAHKGQAAGTTPGGARSAYLFVNSSIDSVNDAPAAVLLGRPWGPLAATVFSGCALGRGVAPLGWDDWGHHCTQSPPVPGTTWCNETFYGEFNSTGPGAVTPALAAAGAAEGGGWGARAGRAWWTHQLTAEEAAANWTAAAVLGNWTPSPPPSAVTDDSAEVWGWARSGGGGGGDATPAAEDTTAARYSSGGRVASGVGALGDWIAVHPSSPLVCNPMDHGAAGDGVTNDTAAVQAAIDECTSPSSGGGGTVLLPSPHTFLSYGLLATLPTPTSSLVFRVEGTLRFANDTSGWDQSYSFCLTFDGGRAVALTGGGLIDGQGLAWWKEAGKAGFRPGLVKTQNVGEVLVSNITAVDSPNHTLELYALDLEVVDATVAASIPCQSPPTPKNATLCSHNTDAIDVHNSRYAWVHRCSLSVGDDNLAIHGNNTVAEDCAFGFGHGASIGSLGTGTYLRNITVRNSSFNGTEQAVRIKADTVSSGSLTDVLYDNLAMDGVGQTVLLTMFYSSAEGPTAAAGREEEEEEEDGDLRVGGVGGGGLIAISNVTFSNIVAHNTLSVAGQLLCAPSAPCTALTVSNVTHTGAQPGKGWSCQAASGTAVAPVTPPLTCLGA